MEKQEKRVTKEFVDRAAFCGTGGAPLEEPSLPRRRQTWSRRAVNYVVDIFHGYRQASTTFEAVTILDCK